MRNGADILMESLRREGVERIFGFPGGALYDIYEALSHSGIQHVLVRHEQGAVHAADGYARASGRVGVCLVTSGPGATNTVTGIATAYADSIPMVVLTGQVHTSLIGNDAFQEVDIIGITRPCTKHNFLVKDVRDLAETMKKAFYLARSGRPGPVLVDLPRNMIADSCAFVWPEKLEMRSYKPNYKPNKIQLQRSAEHLLKAEKPLFIIGGGLVMGNASEDLTCLARELRVPVASTFMGLGGFPGDDPLWLGMLGMHGAAAANRAASEADCIIAAGTRFSDRSTSEICKFASNAMIIQIDIDPTSIRKNVPVQLPLVADCAQAVQGLLEMTRTRSEGRDFATEREGWLRHLAAIKKECPLSYQKSGEIKPQAVIEALNGIIRRDAVVTTDVGQHQMWAGQFFTFTKPRTFLSSGGLGTMGFGVPAAVGAQMARPDALVVAITGDGSIQMNIQELGTIMENKLPIKIVLMNNHALGMVRQWQELFYDKNYVASVDSLQPDFMLLAKSYGMDGYRITTESEIVPELQKALNAPGAALIEVEIARRENVSPIVPPGAALNEMIMM